MRRCDQWSYHHTIVPSYHHCTINRVESARSPLTSIWGVMLLWLWKGYLNLKYLHFLRRTFHICTELIAEWPRKTFNKPWFKDLEEISGKTFPTNLLFARAPRYEIFKDNFGQIWMLILNSCAKTNVLNILMSGAKF